MRRIFLCACFALSCAIFNQVKGQEIGVRFGNVTASDVAFDAVFAFGQFDRLHTNVSFGDNQLGLDVLWDFLYEPLDEEALNWYLGAGPFLSLGDDFQLGAVGEVGVEYHFREVPVSLGIDWRPAFRLVDNTDFTVKGFGINLRYVFR